MPRKDQILESLRDCGEDGDKGNLALETLYEEHRSGLKRAMEEDPLWMKEAGALTMLLSV